MADKLAPKAGDVFQVLGPPLRFADWPDERGRATTIHETFNYEDVRGLEDIEARLESLAASGALRRATNLKAAEKGRKAAAEEPQDVEAE